MPTMSITVRAPLGMSFAAVLDARSELESYLKARFPEIRGVKLQLQNPLPSHDVLVSASILHDVFIAILFTGTVSATSLIDEVTKDVFKFLKKRMKRKKDGISRKSDARRGKRPRKKG